MSPQRRRAYRRRVGAAAGAPLALFVLLAPAARSEALTPRVINGLASPPFAAASVALETTDSYCTAGLWKPRILITAAHCVTDEDNHANVTAPSDLTIYPPGADRRAGPSAVTVTEVIVDPQWRDDKDDIAFLVLSAPLATPIITRMATENEVVGLTRAGATISYVGYGLTGPSGDENSVVSDIPYGVTERLDPDGGSGGVGTFETIGDNIHGTCQGDSGGPWMVQVGAELLYIGPLSGGAGAPCDDPGDFAWENGAVASRHADLIARALAAAGETGDAFVPVVRTCTKVSGQDTPECVTGTTWTYDRCWEAPRASLQRYVAGAWTRVGAMTAKRNRDCPKAYPFNVVFRGDEEAGTVRFRVVLPKQKYLRTGGVEQFTVTHPAATSG